MTVPPARWRRAVSSPPFRKSVSAAYFELDHPSPYMLLVAPVRPEKRSRIPAVTHIDGSARIQTVNPTHSPRFYRLLKEFQKHTGCPLLLSTSFNVRGEPIVESPRQAYQCLMRTGLDCWVLENLFLDKKDQQASPDHA